MVETTPDAIVQTKQMKLLQIFRSDTSKDGAKMVTVCVDTKPDEAIPLGTNRFKTLLLLRIHHQPYAEMVAGGADFAFAARADHVATAILIGAEK
jgi:hypothetical protein